MRWAVALAFCVLVFTAWGGAVSAADPQTASPADPQPVPDTGVLAELEQHYLEGARSFILRAREEPSKPKSGPSFPIVDEIAFGRPDAPVTVVSYISFLCENCDAWMRQVFEPLQANYVRRGQVRHLIRLYPITFSETLGSLALGCMEREDRDPARFRNAFEMLANNVNDLGGIQRIARLGGVSGPALDTCWTTANLDLLFAKQADVFDQCSYLDCPRAEGSDGALYTLVPVPVSLIGTTSPSGRFSYQQYAIGTRLDLIRGFFASIDQLVQATQ